jgi:hypothetical protein
MLQFILSLFMIINVFLFVLFYDELIYNHILFYLFVFLINLFFIEVFNKLILFSEGLFKMR